MLPEITNYELRRELLRAGKQNGLPATHNIRSAALQPCSRRIGWVSEEALAFGELTL
jgi:hypothetical protein